MRKPLIVFVLSIFMNSFVTVGVAHAASEIDLVHSSLHFVNGARANDGLSPLQLNDPLSRIARAHSKEMAQSGEIYHNEHLAEQVSGWSMLGENVGAGPSIEAVNEAFMRSYSHRENIEGRYKNIGIGVVTIDGDVWVTQVFFTPMRHRAIHHRAHHVAAVHRMKSVHRVAAAPHPARGAQPRVKVAAVTKPMEPMLPEPLLPECPYSRVRAYGFYAPFM